MADELEATKTPGFKVGESKTLDEYHKLGEWDLFFFLSFDFLSSRPRYFNPFLFYDFFARKGMENVICYVSSRRSLPMNLYSVDRLCRKLVSESQLGFWGRYLQFAGCPSISL